MTVTTAIVVKQANGSRNKMPGIMAGHFVWCNQSPTWLSLRGSSGREDIRAVLAVHWFSNRQFNLYLGHRQQRVMNQAVVNRPL